MTGEQAATWIGVGVAVVGLASQALYVMRRFTQSESEIKGQIVRLGSAQTAEISALKTQTSTDLRNLGESTAASLKRLEDTTRQTIDHHNTITTMRFDDLGRRVGTVETTLKSITKVVVFPEGRET